MDKKALANSINNGANLTPEERFNQFTDNIDKWKPALTELTEKEATEKNPKLNEIKTHVKTLEQFIDLLLIKRLETIKSQPKELQATYLKVADPFFSKEALKQFIIHFFHFDYSKENPTQLVYREKGILEVETNILFDLYKAKRTIETINTLQNTLKNPDHFKSIFSVEEQQETLKVLKEILKLFFIKTITPEYRKELYQKISPTLFTPGKLAKLKEEGTFYLEEKMLDGTQFRNKIILLIFANEMKTMVQNRSVNIKFNYLDFEIIKNEFLVDWLCRKLKNNPAKDKILSNYKINNISVAELIKKDPKKEPEILKSIPIEQFNDIAEEINEKVDVSLKVPISTGSKKFGELAKITEKFQDAKSFAQDTFTKFGNKLGGVMKNLKFWSKKKKAITEETVTEEKAEELEPKTPYILSVLKKEDIDFAFFDHNEDTYKVKLDYIKKKLGSKFEDFQSNVWNFFRGINENQLIKRNQPIKEWCIPLLFELNDEAHLVIFGAQVTSTDRSSGHKTKMALQQFSLNPYFIYASRESQPSFGDQKGERIVKDITFRRYNHALPLVQEKALTFLRWLIINQEREMFEKSNLLYKTQNEESTE